MRLLLVDDDEVDILGMKRALRTTNVDAEITVAHDGIEALEILRGSGGSGAIPRPYLIVLDLNMPRMTGIEFLAELRRDPVLRRSVVFVLSTSSTDRDIRTAYEHNVAAYINKSSGSQSLLGAVGLLQQYWSVVELP